MPLPSTNIHKRNANGHQTLKNIHHTNKKNVFGGCFQLQVTEDLIQTGLNNESIFHNCKSRGRANSRYGFIFSSIMSPRTRVPAISPSCSSQHHLHPKAGSLCQLQNGCSSSRYHNGHGNIQRKKGSISYVSFRDGEIFS